MNLRFHWMLPKGGEVAVATAKETAAYRTRCYDRTSPARQPDMEGWAKFARRAEEAGIESVLISCGPYEPDSLLTACALGAPPTRSSSSRPTVRAGCNQRRLCSNSTRSPCWWEGGLR